LPFKGLTLSCSHMLKLHLFDLLWIVMDCCRFVVYLSYNNPQQVKTSGVWAISCHTSLGKRDKACQAREDKDVSRTIAGSSRGMDSEWVCRV